MLRHANKGLEVALNKITADVKNAIDQGKEMDEILLNLLQSRITPEDIITVLGNLAIPEMKAKEMVTDALNNLQQQAAQQRQMMAQQQQGAQPGMQAPPQGQPSPEQMMAMAQQMPQEQMQQAPMAMYGMSMGGYNMPFYNNPNEMAYGGVARYNTGGTPRPKDTKKVAKDEYGKSTWETKKDAQGEYKYSKERGKVEGRSEYTSKHAPGGGGGVFKGDLCRDMKTPGTKAYGKSAEEVVRYAYGHHYASDGSLKPEWAKVNAEELAKLTACEVEGAKEIEKAIYAEDEPTTTTTTDTQEEECVCTDPMTGEEAVFPKNADGTCPPCEGYEMEQMQPIQQNLPQSLQYLPEDRLNLGIAMAQRNVNVPPVMGKAPGVREQAQRTDYIAQAELAKGMTQGTINAIQKTAANNPGGAIAAMFAAQRGSQGDIINLASQVNAQNADRATALNKANTQHQYNQLLMDKDASDVYNQRNATWQSNKAQDYNNYWANVGDKFAKMKGNARTLAALNEAQGMKWNIDPVTGDEYYVNTNNKQITPEKPAEDFETKMARFKKMGITDNSDVLRAMDLERKMNVSRYGGAAYKKGGYIYADMLWPFLM